MSAGLCIPYTPSVMFYSQYIIAAHILLKRNAYLLTFFHGNFESGSVTNYVLNFFLFGKYQVGEGIQTNRIAFGNNITIIHFLS